MTHDYKRHGTTTLFAALNVVTGEVVGECYKRHRHDEFLIFLKKLERPTPKDLASTSSWTTTRPTSTRRCRPG